MFENDKTPCYIVDEAKIKKNLEILRNVEKESGAHILLAQKAFSMFSLYPLIGQYISGTTASGLYEAKLGYEAACRPCRSACQPTGTRVRRRRKRQDDSKLA